jgi:hypothetical protein
MIIRSIYAGKSFMLKLPVKRRQALLASIPIEE